MYVQRSARNDGKRNAILRHQPDTGTTLLQPHPSSARHRDSIVALLSGPAPPLHAPSSGTVPQQVFNAAKAAASSDNLNKLYVIICVYQQNNGILNVKTKRCFSHWEGVGDVEEGRGEGHFNYRHFPFVWHFMTHFMFAQLIELINPTICYK